MHRLDVLCERGTRRRHLIEVFFTLQDVLVFLPNMQEREKLAQDYGSRVTLTEERLNMTYKSISLKRLRPSASSW